MHELALMGDILNIVVQDIQKREIPKVKKITLIVGELSNAMPDALEMAFDIYKAEGNEFLHEEAELEIIVEEAEAKCNVCGALYQPTHKIAVCPECHIPGGQVIKGDTFKVHTYEGSY